MKKSPLTVFLAVTGAMLLAAILAVNLAEARRTTTYPKNSAQQVVKSYLEAISQDRKTEAFGFLARESDCSKDDMDKAFGASIDRTIVQFAKFEGGRAVVGIRLEMAPGSSVLGGRSSMDHTFNLVREMGSWKLTGKIWPMDSCGLPS